MSKYDKAYYINNKDACKSRNKCWVENNREYVNQRRNESRRKRKLLAIEFLGGKCARCGEVFHPCQYDLHHKDPTKKDFRFSQIKQLRWEKIIIELEKCELVCSNCHRLIHFNYELENTQNEI